MAGRVSLIWDSVARFRIRQLFYWILNKYIRPLFPCDSRCEDEISGPNADSLAQLCNTARRLFVHEGQLIFDAGRSHGSRHHPYFTGVTEFLETFRPGSGRFAEARFEDPEILSNYHRFHLFDEAFARLDTGPGKQFDIIRDWIASIPRSDTQGWTGFNAALRLINWIKILARLSPLGEVDAQLYRVIAGSITEHLRYIRRNIEYHLPGNHVAVQFYALWLGTQLLPEWSRFDDFDHFARARLGAELDAEFLDSGLHFEQSYHYHLQVTLVSLYWKYNLGTLGKATPANTDGKIRDAAAVARRFVLGRNYCPMLGDNCFAFFHESIDEDLANLRATDAILHGTPCNDAPRDHILDIRNQYLIVEKFDRKLIIDVGNIGLSCNPGHGHSDIFSVLYAIGEVPVLIDPGTKTYGSTPADLLLKRAVAHNTASMDGHDQATLWGFFRWAHLPRRIRYVHSADGGGFDFSGTMEGHRRRGLFKHRRTIQLERGILTITDLVEAAGARQIILSFVLHPDIRTELSDRVRLSRLDGKPLCSLHVECASEHRITTEAFTVYPGYDLPEPSTRISIVFDYPGGAGLRSTVVIKDAT